MAELRMVSAWDTHRESPLTIGRGQADALRPLCHSGRLICPIEGCSNPEFTTRRLYTNRWGTEVADGFRHRVAPQDALHSAESVRHQDAKAQVHDWLVQMGFKNVSTERAVRIHHPEDPRLTTVRRPDVKATSRTGQQLAFEVQVSPIGEAVWQERTTDLRRTGYIVIWLWAWQAGDWVHPETTALRLQISNGGRPWFIEPHGDEGPLLASSHQKVWVDDQQFTVHPRTPLAPLHLSWRPLADHHVAEGAIVTGSSDTDESAAYAAALARTPAQRGATSADASRPVLKPVPAADPRRTAQVEKRRLERIRRAEQRQGTPAALDLPDELEEICKAVRPADDQIWVAPSIWKRALTQRLLTRRQGALVRTREIIDWVEREFPCDRNQGAAPTRDLLQSLAASGFVRLTGRHIIVEQPIQIGPDGAEPDRCSRDP